MDGPDSSFSRLVIIMNNVCWNMDREARIEPPIQTVYFLSGGTMILIFIVLGAKDVITAYGQQYRSTT